MKDNTGRSRQSGRSGFNLTILFEFCTNLTDQVGQVGQVELVMLVRLNW